MPGKRIKFQPNVPQLLKLADPQGEYDFELQTGRYETADGRELVLPRNAVIKLNELAPAAGEEIGICRYEREKRDSWAVWLTASSEKDRAIAEMACSYCGGTAEVPESSTSYMPCPKCCPGKRTETAPESPETEPTLQHQLEASIKAANTEKRRNGQAVPIRKEPAPELQPRLFDRGTGTDGPVPQLAPAAITLPALSKRPPDVIPWNVAFREVAKFVSAELAACNLQWSDEAQQAAVCTVLIAEVKKGRIGLWER